MPAVFISYRRGDASGYAVGMKNDLRARGFEVFMDLDSIGLGKRYPQVIDNALNSSDALIALIGKGWLTAEDDQGRRRLDDRSDFVRREIAAALERDILVIPTLVDGAAMPPEETLPPKLAELALRQALKLDNEHWDHDVQRLIDAIASDTSDELSEEVVEEPPDESAVEPPAVPDKRRHPSPFPLPRRPWIVLAGALGAAAAIAALAFVLTRDEGDGGGVPPEDDLAVERVTSPAFGGAGQQTIFGVSEAGSVLVAVGRVVRGQEQDAPRSAAAWRSVDGGAGWSPASVAGADEAPRQEMKAVARMPGSGFIAVGQEDGEATAWNSPDGASWTERWSLQREGDQFLHAVMARAGLIVAAGSEGVEVGEGRDAAVWWSADDGRTWAQGGLNGFKGKENQEIKGVVAGGNGVVVAVGYDGNFGEAAAWFSRDGAQSWQRVEIEALEDTEQMAAVAAGPSGLVAVGREGEGDRADAAVWKSSNNGRKWRRVAAPEFDLPGKQEMTSVVVTDAGLLAVGSDNASGQLRAAIWRSTDAGESWQRISSSTLRGDEGVGSMTAAVAVGGKLVGLGEGDGDAAVWTAEAS